MMQKSPVISVVMPVYNGERFLEEAIKSILNQTYQDFEFIIINDGSTDSTAKIIESYQEKDSRIRFFDREHNGLAKSLNFGIDKANGKYIARMDTDDISLPQRFQQELNYLERENFDVVGSYTILINEQSRIIGARLGANREELALLNLFIGGAFTHGSAFMRTDLFLKDNLRYHDYPCEDLNLWFQMLKKGWRLGTVPEFLYKLRTHQESFSNSKAKKMAKDTFRICRLMFDKYQRNIQSNIEGILKDKTKSYYTDYELGIILRSAFLYSYWSKNWLIFMQIAKKFLTKGNIYRLYVFFKRILRYA